MSKRPTPPHGAAIFAMGYVDTARRMLAAHGSDVAARLVMVLPHLERVPLPVLAAGACVAIVVQNSDAVGTAIRAELAKLEEVAEVIVFAEPDGDATVYLTGRPEARFLFEERCPRAAAMAAGPPMTSGKMLYFAVAEGRTETMHIDVTMRATKRRKEDVS